MRGCTGLVFEYMFEYYGVMNNPSRTRLPAPGTRRPGRPAQRVPDAMPGVLKAMSPGVVDFLFRQLVAGEPAEDVQWQQEGTVLSAQAPGAELARRLAETELDALTPGELFHYVRAAQRLAAWAEGLREDAVSRYCPPLRRDAPPGDPCRALRRSRTLRRCR